MSPPPLQDPERQLALAYIPATSRQGVAALWALDERLGSILDLAREPTLRLIRLAWWREALVSLDAAGKPPSEPLLAELLQIVLPLGITGSDLSALTMGWEAAVEIAPDFPEAMDRYCRERGSTLFGLTARLLIGQEPPRWVARAGEQWALVDIVQRLDDMQAARMAMEKAAEIEIEERWPVPLRPMGMLAALAARDARTGVGDRRPATPGRMLRMIRHRLTGR